MNRSILNVVESVDYANEPKDTSSRPIVPLHVAFEYQENAGLVLRSALGISEYLVVGNDFESVRDLELYTDSFVNYLGLRARNLFYGYFIRQLDEMIPLADDQIRSELIRLRDEMYGSVVIVFGKAEGLENGICRKAWESANRHDKFWLRRIDDRLVFVVEKDCVRSAFLAQDCEPIDLVPGLLHAISGPSIVVEPVVGG